MNSAKQEFEDFDTDEEVVVTDRVDPEQEDRYWKKRFGYEVYYSPRFEYEDYAPAYCVGYIGYAQYGGEFEDAEKSLCANWLRIKGASRLSIDEALQAIRAAWAHAEQAELGTAVRAETEEDESELLELATAMAGRPAPMRHRQMATA